MSPDLPTRTLTEHQPGRPFLDWRPTRGQTETGQLPVQPNGNWGSDVRRTSMGAEPVKPTSIARWPMVCLLLLFPVAAGAEPAHFLAIERAFGLSYWSIGQGWSTTSGSGTTGNTVSTESGTSFGVGLLQGVSGPYVVPRVAYDYRLESGFTFGFAGGASRGSSSTTSTTKGISTMHQGSTTTAIVAAARLGWQWRLSDRVVFWPRAGLSYYSIEFSSPADVLPSGTPIAAYNDTNSGLGATVEPSLLFTPSEHFGLLLSAAADLPLTGSEVFAGSTHTTTTPYTFLNVGLHFGILASF